MSLAARLSAFFLTALGLVLAGFSLVLYLSASVYLHAQIDERLHAALETLAAATDQDDGGLEWEPHDRHLTLGRDPAVEQVRWQVRDDAGRLVDRSANLGDAELPAGSMPTYDAQHAGQSWRLAQRVLHAATTTAPKGPAQPRHGALLLTAAVSLEPMHALLRALAATLAGLSLLLWLSAAVVGRWLCRSGLAPVVRMSDAARAMDATDLGRRLPDPGTADELATLQRAFNGLLDRVQEAFERQRRFTGDASHQLRTPLTVMLGQLEVSLRRDRPAEEYRRVLALIEDQAGRLRRIVEALLFLARADADADLAALELVDLNAWLDQHLQGWSGHARAGDLQRFGATADPIAVRVQSLLLGQLLDNLLENAFKYSLPGTPVMVALRHDATSAVLEVQDAGPGIAADELPHIFEPFYRGASARHQPGGGVGLGLAVARRIATALGGTLRVDSAPGRGSRFTLRLPAAS
jgi:heavy metal sensor kinase